MQFEIVNTQPQAFVKSLSNQLGLPLQSDCSEETLKLPAFIGDGQITGFTFSGGLSMLVVYCTLNEDWELVIHPSIPNLQFNFCVEGNVRHFLQNKELQYQLLPLQGSITANEAKSQEHFLLPANTSLIFTHLIIDRMAYLKRIDCLVEEMPEALATTFKDQKGKKSFLYHSNYSLSIAEVIKRIVRDQNEGLVRSAFMEGKTLELLSKQVKQFNDDLQLPEKQVLLREYDIAKIEVARDLLINNIKNPPTIEELARLTGINRQKLKSGFKIIYDQTINGYLREHRLEMASLLLASGKNVVQAANEVGYVNQSHFARRFKEKYGVLPKDYLKTIQFKLKNA